MVNIHASNKAEIVHLKDFVTFVKMKTNKYFTFIIRAGLSSSFVVILQVISGLGPPLGVLVLVEPVRSVDQRLEPLEALLVDRVH